MVTRLTKEEEERLIEVRDEIEKLSAQIGPLQLRRHTLAKEEERLNNRRQAARWEKEAKRLQSKAESLERLIKEQEAT